MSRRVLLLFAREPGREARAKGFSAPGADLFAELARGWGEAARRAGAALAVATPPEDRTAWRRLLAEFPGTRWIAQSGDGFGDRLARAVRQASSLGDLVLVAGGDVVPSEAAVAAAFARLEGGEDAVLAPAPDGGVSLIGIAPRDADLLSDIAPRRRDVFERLRRRLLERGRRVGVLSESADVDGPADARRLARRETEAGLRALLRGARAATPPLEALDLDTPLLSAPAPVPPLRAPPAAA